MRFALILCSSLILTSCSKPRDAGLAKTKLASPVSAMLLVSAGSAQMFKATYQDPNGGSHIKEVTFSVMSEGVAPGAKSRWSANECLVRYDMPANAIWLVPDGGGTWGSHPITAGSSSTFSNSQCTVMASGSSAKVDGNMVTINLELEFAPAFAGTKQIYLASADVNDRWSNNYQERFGNFTISAAY